jgi:hypothetical protein
MRISSILYARKAGACSLGHVNRFIKYESVPRLVRGRIESSLFRCRTDLRLHSICGPGPQNTTNIREPTDR